MKKSLNKSKLYMIISISILCLSIIGSTTAYYVQVLFNDLHADTITQGLDYYINYTKGQDIASEVLNPVANYNEGASASVVLWKKDNTYDIYGHIYLDIGEIGENTSAATALKYTLVKGSSVIGEGTLNGYTKGDSVLVTKNIPLATVSEVFTLYIWLDESEEIPFEMSDEPVSLTIRCEATMKEIE